MGTPRMVRVDPNRRRQATKPPRHPGEVVVFGAGSHGKVVREILCDQGYEVLGWLDDDDALWGTQRSGLEVLGGRGFFRDRDSRGVSVAVAIGANPGRMAVLKAVVDLGVGLVNAVHPSAILLKRVSLGRGVCVCPGTVLGVDTRLGDGVIVNTGSTIDHDCVLEDGAWVAPGVRTGGGVTIGQGACVSTGAVLVAGVCIGEGAVVGAGSVVTTDVPPRALVLGVPARVVRRIDESFNWDRLVSGISHNRAVRHQA